MKPEHEKWTIVIAGAWNRRLLGPAWVAKNLLKSGEGDDSFSVEVPVTSPDGVLRYMSRDLIIVPQEDRLVVGMRDLSPRHLRLAEAAATKVLELLPHTPVTALGVNFGFALADLPDELTNLFKLSDATALATFDAHIQPTATSISRQLRCDDGFVLNLKFTMGDSGADVALNFHHTVPSAEAARQKLEGQFEKRKEVGLKLLKEVYGLELEDVDEHQDSA